MDPWAAFTFFGIPLAVGILAGIHSGRLFWNLYDRRAGATDDRNRPPRREQLLRAIGLLAVALFLVAHSGRWLLAIYT